MAEYTENLNLIKPAQEDQYNVDNFNDNFDKIDDFAGLTPPRALTADKLTTGAKINGVNFKGDTDIITGLGLYSDTNTYNNTNLAYLYDNGKLKIFQSIQNNNIGHNPLISSVYWSEIQIGSKRHYGDIVTSSLPIVDDNTLHLADGSLLSQQNYPDFVSYVANLYNSLPSGEFETPTQRLNGSNWKSITYGNGKYIAVCAESGNNCAISTNGENWDISTIGLQFNPVSITYDGSRFLAINTSGVIQTSENGTSWTDQSVRLPSSNTWIEITYGNGKYIAFSQEGKIAISTNGITGWSELSSSAFPDGEPSNANIGAGITYGNGIYLLIDTDTNIFVSTNANTWYKKGQIAGVLADIISTCFDGINFIVLDKYGYMATSNDGINWSNFVQNPILGNNNWTSLAYGNLKTIALSSTGYISVKEMPYTEVFTTEADWQQTYTTYGECGKYVYNSSNNTVRIPLYNSYFTNTVNPQKLGDLTPASIPNIKGTVDNLVLQSSTTNFDWTGAFYNAGIGGDSLKPSNTTQVGTNEDNIGLDASRSSSVYSDSATTVNTQSIKQLVYIVVKA